MRENNLELHVDTKVFASCFSDIFQIIISRFPIETFRVMDFLKIIFFGKTENVLCLRRGYIDTPEKKFPSAFFYQRLATFLSLCGPLELYKIRFALYHLVPYLTYKFLISRNKSYYLGACYISQ